VTHAAIHGGIASFDLLITVLDICGVTLVWLPKYSPELNPEELVFNVVKRYIRNHRIIHNTIFVETLKALASIDLNQMISFYTHCIPPKTILPDLM